MKNKRRNPKDQSKGNHKLSYEKRLFKALYDRPISRRMAASLIGYYDQTYMVTQKISDWIKLDIAKVVGTIKCERSGRIVQAITVNPKYFENSSNQLTIF